MCAAKIIPIGKPAFYLGSGREIEGHMGFSTFAPTTQNQLKRIGVFGVKDGVKVTDIFANAETSISLFSGGGVKRCPKDIHFAGVEVNRRPLRFELRDGSLIIPVTEKTYQRVEARRKRK